MICGKNCEWQEQEINAKECLVTSLEQIFTFDGHNFNYDLCSHLLAKDCENNEFEVVLSQNCTESTSCERVISTFMNGISIDFHQGDRSLFVDGHMYGMQSISALNENKLEQYGIEIMNYGNQMAILGEHVQVIYYLDGDVTINIKER